MRTEMPQHVFVNTAGEAQRPDGVMRDVFRDACTALKLRGRPAAVYTPRLRDTFATGHLMAGKDAGLGQHDAGPCLRGNDASLLLQVGPAGGGQSARERGRVSDITVAKCGAGDDLTNHLPTYQLPVDVSC